MQSANDYSLMRHRPSGITAFCSDAFGIRPIRAGEESAEVRKVPRTWSQLLSVGCVFPLQTMQMGLWAFAGLCLAFPRARTPLFCYVLWYLYLDRAPARGGWSPRWRGFLRRLSVWRASSDYYPIELVKTADLDAQRAYVFGYHPHGLLGIGASCAFGTDGRRFSALFPGVRVALMTLKATFSIPFFREWILAHGVSSCGKKTCVKLLRGGESIAIVVGGAKESLESRPGTMKLYLRNRKGFVRVAIESGASLVPSIGIGENEAFHQLGNAKGSAVRSVQDRLQRLLGFAFPLAYGRWMPPFAPTVPFRSPLKVVIGAPIEPPPVPAGLEVSAEVVDAVHGKYVDALRKLYETYAPAGSPALEIE